MNEQDLILNDYSSEDSSSFLSTKDTQDLSFSSGYKNTFIPIKDDFDKEDYQEKETDFESDDTSNTTNNTNMNSHQTANSNDQKNDDDDEPLDLNNLPETVTILKADDDKTIYLVGTSHFSKPSHRDVRRVIRAVKPSCVVLELCRSRMCIISMDENKIMEEARSLDFTKIRDYMKKNGFVQAFIYFLLLRISAKVTNDLELAPGGEFRNAFHEALKIPGCTVILGDRPIDITVRRAIATLSTWQKIKITFHCFSNTDKVNEEELERYKNKDALEQLVDELSKEFPGLSKVMVDERDSFLAHSLWKAALTVEPGSNIVGVVGIGHSAGIQNKWKDVANIDVSELAKIPENKPSPTSLILKYSFYGIISYGIYRFIIPNSIKQTTIGIGKRMIGKLSSMFF